MSIFGDFFSPSQETQGTTSTTQTSNSNSTSQGNTQNNLWPFLQPYAASYLNTAFNPNAFNANQTNAAARQDAVTGNLTPGFGAAGNIATGGLSPTAYQPYMSQYTQAVVDPTVAEFERLNKSTASDINGNLAARGALGNSNNAATRSNVLNPILNNQKATIAGLYDKGFNTATNTALQSQGQQLQGASTLGQLTGAATGANQAGFNIGQTLWQDPLSWVTQGASGLSPFLQGAGQNTSGSQSGTSTGTSTGFNTGFSQTNPSTFQQIAGIAGLGASLFSDERVKDNIAPIGETFDGQPIYRFNYKGQPETQIGLMAQDVERNNPDAVGSVGGVKTVDYDAATARAAGKGHFADGGGVGTIQPYHSNIHSKFADAFQAISGIKQKYNGGAVSKFDVGGSVGPWNTTVSSFTPYGSTPTTMGDDVVDQAKSNQFGMDLKGYGETLSKYGDNSDHSKDLSAATQASMGALNNQAQGLSRFMAQSQPQPIQGFALGGTADDNDPGTIDPANPMVMPRFPSSFNMTYAGDRNDPGISPLPAIKPYSPRVANVGSYGTPYGQSAMASPAKSPAATAETNTEPSSAWGDVWGGLKRSPLVSGNWTEGGGPAARALLAASGQHIGGPIAQQASEMVKERLAQQNADRMYQQWLATATGRLPNGQLTLEGQKTPVELDRIKAQTELARTQADKQFLLDIEKKKMDYQKQLALEQQEKEWSQMQRLLEERRKREQGAGGDKPTLTPGRYKMNPDGSFSPAGTP